MTPRGPRGRPVNILLVEDNPAEVRLTQEVLREARVPNKLMVARDGEEALEYLRRPQFTADAPRPDIILLDLNLPRRNGWDLLHEIKGDPNLRRIPVVVLTTSSDQEDVKRTYDLHANCFITKPVDLEQFLEVIRSIEHFWLDIVALPANGQC